MTTKSKPVLQEEEIIARLKNRDESAMSLLYDLYSKALFGVVLKVVKTQELAEDVMQEAFLKIWTSIDNYDAEKGRLFTWMLNVSRNLAIDRLRSKQYKLGQRSQAIEDSNLGYLSDSSAAIRPEHIGIKELTEKLKPDQKILVDLLYFEGYTQSEAAEALNLPLGTVKTRVRAALKYLGSII